jgi:uncharacterized protein YcnI
MHRRIIIAAALGALAAPSAAGAHVTLQPKEATAGAFTRLDVRVPTEREAPTTKVEVQFPSGFADASYEPVPGWKVTVAHRKLAKPVKTDEGDTLTEEVSTMTWTATAGGIPPGAFQDFGISVQIPDKAGDQLVFKALQTYRGGEVVRWIGPEGSDEPAPAVAVVAGAGDAVQHGDNAGAETSAKADDEGEDSDTLAIIALIVGGLGLLLGIAGLARRRGV